METKLLIHNQEAEESVIRCIVTDPGSLKTVIQILRPDCFYLTQTREMYKAILSLDQQKVNFDIINITEELRKTGKLQAAGGAYGVSSFLDSFTAWGNIEQHAMLVYEKFALRAIAELSMKIFNQVHEPYADALKIVDMVSREMTTIDFITRNSFQKVGDVVADIILEQRHVIDHGIKSGIGTGFINVDRWHQKQNQELGIIAARPGMGKTAYMLANAKHTAIDLKKPCAIFSLEMSTKKLVGRLMASESETSSQSINNKTLDLSQLQNVGGRVMRLMEAPLYFDDTPGLDIPILRSKIRRMKREFHIEEVYIDYLQLMAGEKKGNREQEISYISRNLKMIAKEEDIPVIALSQLSRDVEKRHDKRPVLSDLRESGAIEQDADWVFFLYRPEAYGASGIYEVPEGPGNAMIPDSFNGKTVHTRNLMVVDCAKYREGALFKAALKFYGEFMMVQNYDVGFESQPEPPTQLPTNETFIDSGKDRQIPKEKDDLPF